MSHRETPGSSSQHTWRRQLQGGGNERQRDTSAGDEINVLAWNTIGFHFHETSV